jgi:hypothetical protein
VGSSLVLQLFPLEALISVIQERRNHAHTKNLQTQLGGMPTAVIVLGEGKSVH